MRIVPKAPAAGDDRRKQALETALQEILQRTSEREELAVEKYADPMDQVQSGVMREVAGQTLEGRARQARAIRQALNRIAQGTYGICERCGERVGEKRLHAVPWARLCIACQAEEESGKHNHLALPAAA